MTPLPDAAARERIRVDHRTTLIVEAAAGTGKTTSVVSRVTEMIARGVARIGEIAAITFTEKAGGELRLRIRQELEARLSGDEGGRAPDGAVRERIEAAIASLEEAPIGTIHAFCSTLLRERPVEAGVDPDFQVLTEREGDPFYETVFQRFLESQLEKPPPGIRRLLRRRARRPKGDSPVDILREAGRRLLEARDFKAPWTTKTWDPAAVSRDLIERSHKDDDGEEIPSLRRLADIHRAVPPEPAASRTRSSKPNWLLHTLIEAATLDQEIRLREAAVARDDEWVEQALATLRVGHYGGTPPPGAPRDLKKLRDRFRARLAAFSRWSHAELAAMLREDLRPLVEQHEAAKARAGVLDFDDLLLKTRDLLRDHDQVRADLQSRFRHIVVDEYQDTDPIQTEIVLLLTSAEPAGRDWTRAVPRPGRLCLVGDPKQSIYRFRRADISHYLAVKQRLLEAGAEELRLTSNFRSVPGICQFVNSAMEPVFREAPEVQPLARQVDYLPLHATREALPGGASVRSIPMPTMTVREIEEKEPDHVAEFVDKLLASGFRIPDREKEGALRPVRPEDICLLFRRFRNRWKLVPEPFADALHDRGIPHSLNAVRTYIGSAELTFLRAALTAVEFPQDELSVYATLRGPLFSFADQDLFRFVRTHGRLRPDRAGALELDGDAPAPDRQIREALGFLFRLHRRRNHRPLAVTLEELLGAHRAEIGFAFWRSPDQVLTNLRRLVEEARTFEAGRGPFGRGLSLRGFVERLATQAESDDASAGQTMDEDVSGVRLMTIHSAKGLEFPVVVLCDAAAGRTGQAGRTVSRERDLHACDLGAGLRPWDLIEAEPAEKAEEIAELDRLLYVGMTRARDLLACPVVEVRYDRKPRFLQAPMGELERRAAAEKAAAQRSDDEASPDRPSSGVIGWRRRGAVRWNILAEKGNEAAAELGKVAEAEFLEARENALREGGVPERRIAPAKRLATEGAVPDLDPVAAEVAIETTEREPGRPGGAGFGRLVHRILEAARFDEDAEALEAAAALAVRELELAEDMAPHGARAALAALGHPILQAAGRAEAEGRAHRELPLVHREDRAVPPAGPGEPGPEGDESAFDSALDPHDEPALPLERGDAELPETTPGPEPSPGPPAEPPLESPPLEPVVVEGVADLVFQEDPDGPWTVVDFKTDAFDHEDPEAAPTLAAYRRQAALYARALAKSTGREANAVLLFV